MGVAVIPSWLRWYKKPSYVDLKAFVASLNNESDEEQGQPKLYRLSQSNDNIPKNLSLERILNNKTCSPLSLYDFYMYLKHVEISQENLEFYLWFKDYQQRFSSSRKPSHSESSPLLGKAYDHGYTEPRTNTIRIEEKPVAKPRYIDANALSDFATYVESLVLYRAAAYPKPCCTVNSYTTPSCEAGTVPNHPHQEELEYIAELFLRPGAPKELNIPPSLRKATVEHLAISDSTDFLSKVADQTYIMLKFCSHQNFIRLGVNNGTVETLCMVTMVGILFSVLGFVVMFSIAFGSPSIHHSSRWRGLASIPFWFIGISFLLAGLRGSCFLLLLFSHRQELPWERVKDESSMRSKESSIRIVRFAKKLMIFERKVRVKDVGLRRLQRKIVIQSVVGACIGTAILEVVFLCLPIWK